MVDNVRLPDDLVQGLVRHGITPKAGVYQLMDEVQKRGWASEIYGARWREASTRFTRMPFYRVRTQSGGTNVQHILVGEDSGTPWKAEEGTP